MIIESNHGTPLINLDLKMPSIDKYNLEELDNTMDNLNKM
ncbi:13639_t:CDS:2 [Gigaspora margarita]|uniref:13639_t:CDS:1 n=1 Tax=Gigaspora margarita TaxID=4874 RepID=A0ABN7V042_GIGMA|nr:13639_t:CDS:2 [Gigaspora margarita]